MFLVKETSDAIEKYLSKFQKVELSNQLRYVKLQRNKRLDETRSHWLFRDTPSYPTKLCLCDLLLVIEESFSFLEWNSKNEHTQIPRDEF